MADPATPSTTVPRGSGQGDPMGGRGGRAGRPTDGDMDEELEDTSHATREQLHLSKETPKP